MKASYPAVITLVFSLAALPAPALAEQVALAGDVKLVKLREADGHKSEDLVEPKVVVPGDKLLFATRYRNDGTLPVTDFVVTNPLPAGVSLAPDDAEQHQVSVDGGKTWGQITALTVTDVQGGIRAATASDVTHLRWTVARIPPGGAGVLTYRAIVR